MKKHVAVLVWVSCPKGLLFFEWRNSAKEVA
jgi:hypothetical protein